MRASTHVHSSLSLFPLCGTSFLLTPLSLPSWQRGDWHIKTLIGSERFAACITETESIGKEARIDRKAVEEWNEECKGKRGNGRRGVWAGQRELKKAHMQGDKAL